MEKITEFRNTLAVPIHKLSIDSLVQEVCLCPEYFEDIYRLTYDENRRCHGGQYGYARN